MGPTLGYSSGYSRARHLIQLAQLLMGVWPRNHTQAAYSAVVGALSGGIGFGLSAAVNGAVSGLGTSLFMSSGEGRQVTEKVANDFFVGVIGMSRRSAYAAASVVISTGVSIGISVAAQGAQFSYNKMVGHEAIFKKGVKAIPKNRFDLPDIEHINVGMATTNPYPEFSLKPRSLGKWIWNQAMEEGGIMSHTVNEIPGMNPFAVLHDTMMANVGLHTTPIDRIVVNALNFSTMPPALAITYGALAAPDSLAVGVTSTTSSAITGNVEVWE